MKYGLMTCAALALALALTGCASGAGDKAESQNEPPAASSTQNEAPTATENARQKPVPAGMENETPITLYASHFVDGAETMFRCATIYLPPALEVSEVATIEAEGVGEAHNDGTTLEQRFAGFDEHAISLIVSGSISDEVPSTNPTTTISTTVRVKPFTLEGLQTDFPVAVIEEIAVGDASGFVVMPDPTATETGSVFVNVYLNVGSVDDGIDTKHLTVSISYVDGVMNYADVDFDLLEKTMLERVVADFAKVE